MSRQAFLLRFLRYQQIAPSVRHFIFERVDEQCFDFVPGQFITLLLPNGDVTLRRSYSLASEPVSGSKQIEFAASYVEGGFASQLLFSLQVGDELSTTGPFGRLILPQEPPKRYIFMATGTGVTPYRTMLSLLKEQMAAGVEVVLLQGARLPEDLLYYDEFSSISDPRFHYHPCLSRFEQNTGQFHPGYIQQYLGQLSLNPEEDLVYLCGNPRMIDDTFSQLTAQNFPSQRIKREKYISSN